MDWVVGVWVAFEFLYIVLFFSFWLGLGFVLYFVCCGLVFFVLWVGLCGLVPGCVWFLCPAYLLYLLFVVWGLFGVLVGYWCSFVCVVGV